MNGLAPESETGFSLDLIDMILCFLDREVHYMVLRRFSRALKARIATMNHCESIKFFYEIIPHARPSELSLSEELIETLYKKALCLRAYDKVRFLWRKRLRSDLIISRMLVATDRTELDTLHRIMGRARIDDLSINQCTENIHFLEWARERGLLARRRFIHIHSAMSEPVIIFFLDNSLWISMSENILDEVSSFASPALLSRLFIPARGAFTNKAICEAISANNIEALKWWGARQEITLPHSIFCSQWPSDEVKEWTAAHDIRLVLPFFITNDSLTWHNMPRW